MARRGDLPDLPPVVRGLERRRHRRPRGHPQPARPPRVARRRRHLAEPDQPVPEQGLGLRRLRLLRRPPGPRRHGRRSSGWSRRRASAASACCSTSSRTTRATSTRGSPTRARRGTPRTATGTCGPTARTAGRRTTGRASFGGPAWTFDEADRPVVPAPLPAGAARPQLVERTRSGRRSTTSCASGSTAGIAGFRIDVATGSSRTRSSATTRRDPEDDRAAQAGVLDEPAGDARRLQALAQDLRGLRPAAPAGRRDVRRSTRSSWPRSTATATSSSSPSTSPASTRRSRPSRCAGSSSRPRRRSPTAAGRSGRCPTTTSSASRRAGRTATRPRSAARSWSCCCLRGTPGPLLRRRDRARATGVPKERELDFAGHRDGARTPMRWSGEPGHGFTERRRRALAAVRHRPGRGVAARRSRFGAEADAVTCLPHAASGRICAPGRTPRFPPRTASGRGSAATATRSRSTWVTARRPSSSRGRSSSGRTAIATASRSRA